MISQINPAQFSDNIQGMIKVYKAERGWEGTPKKTSQNQLR